MPTQIISGLPGGISPTAFGTLASLSAFVAPTGEPQRSYLWEVSVGPPTGLTTSSGGYLSSLVSTAVQNVENNLSAYAGAVGITTPRNDQNVPNLLYYAKSISIPSTSVDVIEDNFMGDKYVFAGKISSPRSLTINFWDDQHFTTFGFLQTWINQLQSAYSHAGRQVPKGLGSRTIKISLKDTSNLFTILVITLNYALITSVGDISLDYAASDAINISGGFVFDSMDVGTAQKEPTTPGFTG